ncbi:unnamed protein product [Arabis nemorensis]|uniref:Uncharacterized protein n=1 Tax=Arabis nemorensis TaxID=586526 RepID=A0A565BDJ8_9BRAS|nr:unnamed protein product [Arabis nemorensis]
MGSVKRVFASESPRNHWGRDLCGLEGSWMGSRARSETIEGGGAMGSSSFDYAGETQNLETGFERWTSDGFISFRSLFKLPDVVPLRSGEAIGGSRRWWKVVMLYRGEAFPVGTALVLTST